MKNALLVLTLLFTFSVSNFAQDATVSIDKTDLKKTKSNTLSSTPADVPKALFLEATQMASTQLAEFAHEHIQYPESLKDQQFEGTVLVDVWISSKGEITKIKVVKSFNKYFDEYILRAFDKLSFLNLETSNYYGAKRIRLPMNFSFE